MKSNDNIEENLAIEGRKNYPQMYRELCIALNCNINNSVNHAYDKYFKIFWKLKISFSFKNSSFTLNLQLLQKDDIQPLSILFKQFKFTAFNLYGCDYEKIEKTKNILSNTKNSLKSSKSSIMCSDKKNNSIVSETKSIAKKKNDFSKNKNSSEKSRKPKS